MGGRLYGRECEVGRLADHLERAVAGHGQVAFVEGEAGIGKTRLLEEVVAVAEDRGFAIFLGHGEELEATRPFGVLADALGCQRRSLDPAYAAISQLLHGEDRGTSADGPTLRFRTVEAFVELVERLSTAGPALLILEDLHWGDPSTLLGMRVLGRRLRFAPVALIGSFRPTPCCGELERLVDTCTGEGGLHLRLGPLDETAVARLATEMVGGAPGPRLRQRLSGAGGNPLFVLELIEALREASAVQLVDGRAEVGEVALPPTLRASILRRLSFLSPGSVELLRLASVLGSTLSLVDMAAVCRRPVLELLPAVGEALQVGLLGEDGHHLAFRHDLVREAVYCDLPYAVRVALHREAGHALAAAGAPASRVAAHLAVGAAPGDTEAVKWLCRAAREAVSRAPGVAADLFGRAAELIDADDLTRETVVADQVHALLWSGRIGDAHTLARQVLDRCHDPVVEVSLRVALSWALALQGNMRDAVEITEVVPRIGRLDDRQRVQLRASAALYRIADGDMRSVRMATAARREAERLGDDVAWCAAGCALAYAARRQGRLDAAITELTQVAPRAESSPLTGMYRMVCDYMLVQCLRMADRLDQAAEALSQAKIASRERGSIWNLPVLHYASGLRDYVAGNWDDAAAETEAGLAVAKDLGAPVGAAGAHGLLALLAVHRGQLPAAKTHLADAEHARLGGAGSHAYMVAWARGLGHEAAGRPGQGLDCLEEAWAEAAALGMAAEYPQIGPDLVRLALTTARQDRAAAVFEAVEEAAARMGTASAEGAALRCRGLVDADPETLLQAVARYRAAPRPFERARACEDAAVALCRHGRHDEARPPFGEALQTYENLAANYHIARIRSAMRMAGIKRAKQRISSRPAFGWDALTETELRVVDLVAEGLTNAQIGDRMFISHHTVATHLAHIFVKLGLTSRVELTAQASRRAQRSLGPGHH